MIAPLFQAQHRQQFFQILFVGLLVVQQHWEDDVLFYRQFRDQIKTLEDEADIPSAEHRQVAFLHRKNIFAVDEHLAGSGSVQRTDHIQQRTFAGTRLTDNRNKLTFGDGEGGVFQSMNRSLACPVCFGDILNF